MIMTIQHKMFFGGKKITSTILENSLGSERAVNSLQSIPEVSLCCCVGIRCVETGKGGFHKEWEGKVEEGRLAFLALSKTDTCLYKR